MMQGRSTFTVSLISEGVLPTSVGGVGRWLDYLINEEKNIRFNLIVIGGPERYSHGRIIHYERIPLKNAGRVRSARPEILRDLLKLFLRNDENPLYNLKRESVRRYADCPPADSRIFWGILTEFYRQYFHDRPYLKFFLTVKSLLSPLIRILRIDEPPRGEVYHALNSGYAGFAGTVMKCLTGRPLLVTVHGIYEDEREWELRYMQSEDWLREICLTFFKKLCMATYEAADLIVTINESNKRRIVELGAAEGKIEVIENPVDASTFRPRIKSDDEKIIIGTVTRIVPMKGVIDLIHAAKHLAGRLRNFEVVIVGPIQDEKYLRKCRDLAKKLGVSGIIRFIGQDDPVRWYERFDIFVLPSLMERSPMAVLEAMASGLPIICTETPGTKEMVGGYWPLTPPGKPRELAEQIYRVASSLDESRRKALKIREEIIRRYSVERFAIRYLEVYERLRR